MWYDFISGTRYSEEREMNKQRELEWKRDMGKQTKKRRINKEADKKKILDEILDA